MPNQEPKFDYEKDMREHYRSDEVAKNYHDAFAHSRGIKAWRHRWVAARERAIVERFLGRIPHGTVLDIPTGTGKMAPILAKSRSQVVACDISENMLEIAKRSYVDAGVTLADARVCDAEKINETLGSKFDAVICVRLLHRVPADVKRRILSEIAKSGDNAVVSFGVESRYHTRRRAARQAILGGDGRGWCYEPMSELEAKVNEHFIVLDKVWVHRLFSQEVFFLLRSRHAGEARP